MPVLFVLDKTSMDVVTFYCTKQVYAYQKNCVSAKTVESLCEQPEDALECRSGNSATPAFYIGPNMIECTTPWHEVSRLVVLGIGSSESKDVFRLFEFEFLNPFELGSIRSDSGSVKGSKFVSVHEKSNNLVAFNGVIGLW